MSYDIRCSVLTKNECWFTHGVDMSFFPPIQASEWNDPSLEPVVTYRFLFVIRLYLTDLDPDFRSSILRLLRHVFLSDRILQLCCDLLIPEFVSPCLERARPPEQGQVESSTSSSQWCIEERVHALKLIRRWCSSFVMRQTSVPIPICFLRSLVAVSRPRQSPTLTRSSRSCLRLDPLQLFCIGTLRDLIVESDVATFRRLSDVRGISVLIEAVGDVDVFETEPGFCRSLIVTLSAVFGDETRRLRLGEFSRSGENNPGAQSNEAEDPMVTALVVFYTPTLCDKTLCPPSGPLYSIQEIRRLLR